MSGIKIGGKTLTPINVAPIKIGSKTLSPVNSIKIGNKTLTPISETSADGPSDTQRFFRQMGSKLAPVLDTAEAVSDKALAGAGLVSQKAGELGLRALGAGADALGFDNAGKSLKDTADELGQTFSQSAEAVGQTGGAGTTRIIGRGLKNFVTGQAAANQKLARGINNVLADTADFYGADRARDFFRENSNLASSAINKIENFGDNDMKGWQAAGEIADATALAPAMLGHSAKAARLAKALGASQKVATRIGNAVGSAANGAIMGGFTGGARAYGQPKPDLKQAGLESTIWGGANAILGGLSRAPILAKGMRKLEEARVAAQELKPTPAKAAQDIQSATSAGQTAGEGFTMSGGTTPYQYAEQKFKPEEWVNNLSGVLSDEWAANLKTLALKHPEMFRSEADVFRVIKEIKDNPTHFFKNNRDDIALVSKILDDGNIGKVGIVKDSGKVGHASKSSNKKELKRLQDVNKKQLGVGAPHPTLRSSVSPLAEQKAGANAHSLANESIISQKGNLVNEKEANGLRDSVSSIGDNASRQTAGTSTLPTPLSAADKTALKQNANSAGEAYSSATKHIIPQNPANRLVEKIIELDDAGEIGDMLRKTIINKDISTKTKLAAINAAKRRLVAITAKNAQKDDKKQK